MILGGIGIWAANICSVLFKILVSMAFSKATPGFSKYALYYCTFYLNYFSGALGILIGVSYGSVWFEGVNTGALLRYLFASPF